MYLYINKVPTMGAGKAWAKHRRSIVSTYKMRAALWDPTTCHNLQLQQERISNISLRNCRMTIKVQKGRRDAYRIGLLRSKTKLQLYAWLLATYLLVHIHTHTNKHMLPACAAMCMSISEFAEQKFSNLLKSHVSPLPRAPSRNNSFMRLLLQGIYFCCECN